MYADLKAWKRDPCPRRAAALRARFDRIFRRRTGYVVLDRLLARLHRRKDELLRVLQQPDILLHTNGSENDFRACVTKRKVSGGTVSTAGRTARDVLLGLMKTCRNTATSLLALLMILPVAAVPVHAGPRPSFWRIISRIRAPGLALALQGVGSATIGAFVALIFLSRGWPHAGLGLTCFGAAFVLVRLVAGHLPDRIGSIPVALASMATEALGQLLLWGAHGPLVALAGTMLTGLGCSLMFPAMGIEVVRRVPPHLGGTAAGGLAMFQDLALGATGPLTGLLADRSGYGIVFLVGGLAAALSFLVVLGIARQDRRQEHAVPLRSQSTGAGLALRPRSP